MDRFGGLEAIPEDGLMSARGQGAFEFFHGAPDEVPGGSSGLGEITGANGLLEGRRISPPARHFARYFEAKLTVDGFTEFGGVEPDVARGGRSIERGSKDATRVAVAALGFAHKHHADPGDALGMRKRGRGGDDVPIDFEAEAIGSGKEIKPIGTHLIPVRLGREREAIVEVGFLQAP